MLIRTGFRLNSGHHFTFHFQGRNAYTSRASKELGWYDTRITFASRYKLFLGKQVREINAGERPLLTLLAHSLKANRLYVFT